MNKSEALESEILGALMSKVGLIGDAPDVDQDSLHAEREKRMMKSIAKDLIEFDDLWKVTELEETQIKLEVSAVVFDFLIEETVDELKKIKRKRE